MIDTIAAAPEPQLGHVRVLGLALSEARPSPENDRLYRPVDADDPKIVKLAESIEVHGVQEPLLLTEDRWIISGRRRYVAAQLAGLDAVPCRVAPIHRDSDHDRFVQLLRECSRRQVRAATAGQFTSEESCD